MCACMLSSSPSTHCLLAACQAGSGWSAAEIDARLNNLISHWLCILAHLTLISSQAQQHAVQQYLYTVRTATCNLQTYERKLALTCTDDRLFRKLQRSCKELSG
jgi:hypothetical protein